MKDLYSVHTSEQDLDKYYWEMADSYQKVFKRIGLDSKIVEAAGGVFTKSNTHEFQVLCETGEDIIYYCDGKGCGFAENKEITKVKDGDKCKKCAKVGHDGTIHEAKSIEVGNIFRFGTVYSEKMNVLFTDSDGIKKPAFLGSYGIGLTRLMGTLVEKFFDDKGIIWPKSVAPYQVYLIEIQNSNVKSFSEEVYEKLSKAGIEVLWDDRQDVSAGEKFADCDLIGIPYRLVISDKTGKDKVEVKERAESKIEQVSTDQLLKKLSK
jgi:prolyl-tRNA synthetase